MEASTAMTTVQQNKFKKPISAKLHKVKPKILTEERYIEELSKIIQRDFFPDLERLKAQNEYLDAEATNDFKLMEEVRTKYIDKILGCSKRSNNMSPSTFDTPMSSVKSTPHSFSKETPVADKINALQIPNTSLSNTLSVDQFLHRYTSEDNHSFQEIIEASQEKLRQKFSVLFNQEKLSANQLERALLLPSIEQQFSQPDPMRAIETWKYTNVNSVMYVPDSIQCNEKDNLEANKQTIKHSATRLQIEPTNEAKESYASTYGNTSNPTASDALRGYDLLKSPSPRPGEMFSPIMTWGEIEGTPFFLNGNDTPLSKHTGPSFKINENSRRENMALALADKAGAKLRAQKQQALKTARQNYNSPFIRSGMERLASMSPAAQRFATGKLGLQNNTPFTMKRTPQLNRKPSASSMSLTSTKKTILDSKQPATNTINIDPGSTLTDDLLKIPNKRRKASDFF